MRKTDFRRLKRSAALAAFILAGSIPGLTAPDIAAADGNSETIAAAHAVIQEGYGKLPLGFEANTGRMHDSIKFLARGKGYAFYLSPTEALLRFHRGPKPGNHRETERQAASTGIVRLRLVGANAEAPAIGHEELPGKTHYLVGNDPARWRTGIPSFARVRMNGVYPGIDLVYYGNNRQLEYDWIVSPGADPAAIRFVVEGDARPTVDEQGDLFLDSERTLRLKKPFIYQESEGARVEVEGSYRLLPDREVGFQLASYDASKPLVIDPILSYSTYLGGSDDDRVSGIAVDSMGNAYISGHTYSGDFTVINPLHQDPLGETDAFVAKLNTSGTALVYSTYLGGTDSEKALAIAADASGNAFITGYTWSTDFPTVNPVQDANKGQGDIFIAKLNSRGSSLEYSTFLGGSGSDYARSIALDSSGNAYVTGYTNSTDFPTANALQGALGGDDDAFVTKLNPSGTALVYSTYIGGSGEEEGQMIAIDSSNNAYVVGETQSSNFPLADAIQASLSGGHDVFLAKLNETGTDFVYSTYLGGTGTEEGRAIAVDSDGSAYLVGETNSTDFPTANPFQESFGGGYQDAFVTKLDANGGTLVFSTYLGGSGTDVGNGIALDDAGNIYVVGRHTGSLNFPTANPFQASLGGGETDAFFAALNPSGSALLFSTCLGGSSLDEAMGIAIDKSGNVYLAGWTYSLDFPTIHPLQATNAGEIDAFIARIRISGAAPSDVNGDGKADFTVWRPQPAVWFSLQSGDPASYSVAQYGAAGDKLVPGDYDGDGRMDLAVWRPESGTWFVQQSAGPGSLVTQWGAASDLPAPGDYDGDGKTDLAVFRPDNGTWFVRQSADPGSVIVKQWGAEDDIPVPGDYDGDGKADLAVFRPDSGTWFVQQSADPGSVIVKQWGAEADVPAPGDYDGDGRTDIAVWRPDAGFWFVQRSGAPEAYAVSWGTAGDVPVPGDYDGDGRIDLAVWRPGAAIWFVLESGTSGSYTTTQWGDAADIPVSPLTVILGAMP